MGFFPCMGEILLVFPTFMGVFPIPPLSRGRSGGGWGIYVAVVLMSANEFDSGTGKLSSNRPDHALSLASHLLAETMAIPFRFCSCRRFWTNW